MKLWCFGDSNTYLSEGNSLQIGLLPHHNFMTSAFGLNSPSPHRGMALITGFS